MKIIAVIREKRDNIEGKEFCDEIYTFEEVTKEIIYKVIISMQLFQKHQKQLIYLMLISLIQ